MSLAITTSYAGEFSGKYIAAALLSGDTLANEEITIMPNVRFKSVIQKASTNIFLQHGKVLKWGTRNMQTYQLLSLISF